MPLSLLPLTRKPPFIQRLNSCIVQFRKTVAKGKKPFKSCTMIATTNSTEGGTQTEAYRILPCSPSSVVGLQQQSIYFSAVHIFLSITAFLGNFLILAALNKESSLHPPSKLLYRCLATTNLLVGLLTSLSLLLIGPRTLES